MVKSMKQQCKITLVFTLAALVLSGCVSLNIIKPAKIDKTEKGASEYFWDREWTKVGTLRWYEHDNYLFINEEKGWAKGTFGRVENHDNYYHLRPIYRFTVVEPNKREKEIVVKMGYIEDENALSASKCLEGCWSEKVTFAPGSKVIDGTVVRDYVMEYLEIPSKCIRKSPPF